jgi:alpha-amylase/alpha-mannosidase (GH57 family)
MDLAILWHFHQPIYRRPRSRDYVLPWVNFHATKNYYQMARLAEETGFPCTYNFAPCLLEQIEDYARGTALDPFQLALELPPERLGPDEIERLRKFVTDETHALRLQRRALESFFSPIDPLPADPAGMFQRQKEIHQGLIPLWKKLGDERRAELTVSPYYHPLLPMIFDAAAAGPESPPGVTFRHPGDGHMQIRTGREYFRSVFGRYPKGIWPSEGGVSREAVAAIAEAGFAFAVTDENILWKSLGGYDRRALFKPHRAEGLTVFFRDRELSDLIGFEYQRWPAKDAVADLLRRLDERRPDCDEDSLVVLALDGENPWGTFPQNGLPFLRELYARLSSHPGITPVFFEDYLARHRPSPELALAPGTWLGNFSKWSGSPAKNRGWEILARARKACGPLEEILIAEGSDWFWWFGEAQTEEFTFLFEQYIREAYRRAGLAHE